MILVIKELIFSKMKSDLEKLNVVKIVGDDVYYANGKKRKWNDDKFELDLATLTRNETESLLKMIQSADVHGTRILATDIKKYLKASDEGMDGLRARTVRQAAWMLEHYFSNLPHHTIFSEDEYGGNSHSGYYVGDVDFSPEHKDNSGYIVPAEASFDLWRIENDSRRPTTVTIRSGDCVNMTCEEILEGCGYVPETHKLMQKLRKETERFYEERAKIGKQYHAVGLGLCDLDDALSSGDRYSWRRDKIKIDKFGATRVLVDVLEEKESEEKEPSRKSGGPDPYRWHNWNMRFHTPSEDDLVRHLEADEDTVEPYDVDIPVHPLVPCFDLKRHLRMRIHINNLTPYEYNKKAGERLILPKRDWDMINLLVDQSQNDFQDIVAGKGQSMSILAAGSPGSGKTCTAEIFSEFKERPLYTVQCAQLGMSADEIEKQLGTVLTRANRWNAVLLLDEADVYIRKRGTDMNHNAIVGTFLRLLEYVSCILFMTTNLGDSVDDAITSRCIAKLTYGPPSIEDQKKIWRILADLNKIEIGDAEIAKVADKHPHLSGRDCKNLIKLASFMSQAEKKPMTAKMIEQAMIFKPTETFTKGSP